MFDGKTKNALQSGYCPGGLSGTVKAAARFSGK
jgi:hypothetical protein